MSVADRYRRRKQQFPVGLIVAGSVGGLLLLCLIVGLAMQGTSNERRSPVAANSDTEQSQPVESSPVETEWFKGGNLHKKSLLDWKRADRRNRLATAADIVTIAYDDTNMDNLRERATKLEGQITEVAMHPDLTEATLSRKSISETATSLVILLADSSLYRGTLLDWKHATIPERTKMLVAWGHMKFPDASRGEVLDLADTLTNSLDDMVRLLDSNAALEKEAVSHHLEYRYNRVADKPTTLPESSTDEFPTFPTPATTTKQEDSQQAAIATLRSRGAKFQRNNAGTIVKINLKGTAVTDDDLALLAHFPDLVGLDLKECRQITDDGLKHAGQLYNLTGLDVSYTGIGDNGIAHLNGLAKLATLSLWETNVSGDGLQNIYGLKQLQNLYLPRSSSQVSNASVQALQRNLPNCKVYR